MKALRFLVLALAASAMAQTEPAYDLVWKPKAEDVLDYRLALEIDVEDYRFRFDSDVKMKVLTVAANGDYEIETSMKNTKIRFQDEEEMTPEETDPTVEKFNSRGERIEEAPATTDDEGEEDADPIGELLEQMADFTAPEKPVKKGEKWSHEIKADEKRRIPAARLDYEVVALEEDGNNQLVRIDYSYRQTEGSEPVVAEGTYRLRAKDFALDSFETELKNFKMDQDAPAGRAKLTMRRS